MDWEFVTNLLAFTSLRFQPVVPVWCNAAYLHPESVLTSTPQEGTPRALWYDQRSASPPSSWQHLSSCAPAEKTITPGTNLNPFNSLLSSPYLTCWCSWWCGPGPSSGRCRAPRRRCVLFRAGCLQALPPPRIPDGDAFRCWRLRMQEETFLHKSYNHRYISWNSFSSVSSAHLWRIPASEWQFVRSWRWWRRCTGTPHPRCASPHDSCSASCCRWLWDSHTVINSKWHTSAG